MNSVSGFIGERVPYVTVLAHPMQEERPKGKCRRNFLPGVPDDLLQLTPYPPEAHRAPSPAAPQIATCVPISTTRPVGIWKYSVASAAVRARKMNSLSCQRGIPELADALRERRDRKNEVVMISNFQPCLRQLASARGIFGCSI